MAREQRRQLGWSQRQEHREAIDKCLDPALVEERAIAAHLAPPYIDTDSQEARKVPDSPD